MPRLRHWKTALAADDGSAALEFLSLGVLMLVPFVYLIVALASIQGAALAVEGAARAAARVYVQAPSAKEGVARASRAVEFALADDGMDVDDARVSIRCTPKPRECLTRRGLVTVTVTVRAPLPLAPDALDLRNVASVPLRAQATQEVSRFWGAG